jgi:hypothetical protein
MYVDSLICEHEQLDDEKETSDLFEALEDMYEAIRYVVLSSLLDFMNGPH